MPQSNHSVFLTFKWVLLFFLGLTFLSCNPSPTPENDVLLARVGKEYLTLQKALEEIPDFTIRQDSINVLRRYRNEWIQDQILLEEALRLGLDHKKEVQEKINKAKNEILRQALKSYIISANEDEIAITDQQAQSYYQQNQEQFVLEEEFVRFRHMRARTSADARAAKRDLLYAVPWPEVAREYAINPEGAIQNSKKFWPLSLAANNVDIMNRYLNIIGQMEISPIQRVGGVYHFVQLIESRAKGEHPNLDWLMGQIKDWMILNKRQRHFNSYVQNLYLKAKSNNEVESFNVLAVNPNQKSTVSDTLEITFTDE